MDLFKSFIAQHKLFLTSSTVVIIGATAVNILNYLFNLVISRLLTPAEFAVVATLMGLLVIVSVPSASITTFIAKYVAEYQQAQRFHKIHLLQHQVQSYALAIGLTLLVIFVLLNPLLSSLLKIDSHLLYIFSLTLPLSLLLAVRLGLLQGLQRFKSYISLNIINALVKIVAAVALIWIGWSVAGVMTALVVSGLVAFVLAIWMVNHITKKQLPAPDDRPETKLTRAELAQMGGLIFLATLMIALFNNIDVILAKSLLTDDQAGLYAGMAVIGRIVTYGALSLVTVMVPLVAATKSSPDNQTGTIFRISLLAVTAITVPIVLALAFFPEFFINLLIGSQYIDAKAYLGWYGLAMLTYTFSTVFIQFFIAGHDHRFIYPLSGIVGLIIVSIYIFRQDLQSITTAYLGSGVLLLAIMIGLYLTQPPIATLKEEL